MFSDRLRKLRKEKGVTQQDIATIVGVTYQAVGKWERGIATPDFEALGKIADYFLVNIDYLLGRTNIRHSILGDPFDPNTELGRFNRRENALIQKFRAVNDTEKQMVETMLDVAYNNALPKEKVVS